MQCYVGLITYVFDKMKYIIMMKCFGDFCVFQANEEDYLVCAVGCGYHCFSLFFEFGGHIRQSLV